MCPSVERLPERRDALPSLNDPPARSRSDRRLDAILVLAFALRVLYLLTANLDSSGRVGHAAHTWARFWKPSGEPVPLYGEGSDQYLIAVSDWYLYGLLALGLAAMAWMPGRAGPMHLVLSLTIVWVTLLHMVVLFGDSRFHFPLLPVLATLAGGLLASASTRTRRREIVP